MNTAVKAVGRGAWSVTKVSATLAIKSGPLIKAVKLVKIAKPLLTVATMLVSMVAYAFWLGPWFSVGFVTLLFAHEMGHVIAMRMRGLETATPLFIPFVGAAILAPKFTSRDDEAFVGFGGPLLGTLAALSLWIPLAFLSTDNQAAHILVIVCFSALWLNLFNLIPVHPLDGGRILQALGPKAQYAGVAILFALSLFLREPSILLIWILALLDFTFLSAKLRAYAMRACWVAMLAFFCLGFGHQHWIANVIDLILGGLFVFLTFWSKQWKMDIELSDLESASRPQLDPERKITWGAAYAVMAFSLLLAMAAVVPMLPDVPKPTPAVQVQ